MPDDLRIIVVDPDLRRRQEVRDALSALPFTIVAEARYGVEALRSIVDLHPDLILIRVEARTAPGLHMLSAVQDAAPRSTPVALTQHDDAAFTRRLMLAGARAQIIMPSSREVLRDSLTAARQRHVATLQQLERADECRPAPGGSIIAVLGAKGGVGKTTLAVNLAMALASSAAAAVALVDIDPVYGDVSLHMGINRQWDVPAGSTDDVGSGSEFNAHAVEHPSGVFVFTARPGPTGALPEALDVRRGLAELARRFDFIVVDTPDGLADQTVAATEAADLTILLTSSDVSSVKDARVLRDTLYRGDFDASQLKLVVNHATAANSVTDGEISHVVGEPVFWSFPHDREASRASQTGEPLMSRGPRSSLGRGVWAMAQMIAGLEPERRHTRWSRLWSRRSGQY